MEDVSTISVAEPTSIRNPMNPPAHNPMNPPVPVNVDALYKVQDTDTEILHREINEEEEQHILNTRDVVLLEGNMQLRSSPTNSSSDENDVEYKDYPTCSICIDKITRNQTLTYNLLCAQKMHKKCCELF